MPENPAPTETWVPAALSALSAALGTDPNGTDSDGADPNGTDPNGGAPYGTVQSGGARRSEELKPASPLEFQGTDTVPGWTSRQDVSPELAAVIVRTSGSTGTPKQTMLPASAIRASVAATEQALGGPGQWLLTLQPSYVAGLAVLARSLAAETQPVPLLRNTTDPEAFTAAAQQLTAHRRFVSLVPTQLQRLLEHVPHHEALAAALARFDAILLGGGASSAELLDLAAAHGLNVVRTYGMSETCGGCVYDGHPLPGVHLDTVSSAEGTSARVRITGPMVASGYLEDPELTAAHFSRAPGSDRRSFLTDDLGVVGHDSGAQTLSITGRIDDVINTGGVKVSAEAVRSALLSQPEVREAFVAPVTDAEWGQQVSAAVVLTDAERDVTELRSRLGGPVREALGRAAVPKRLLILAELPLLPSGKPDRQRLLELLRASSR